jgi:PEGA domain-containing protein
VGLENQSPLHELELLEQQVYQVAELAGLKPIFFRVDELAKEYPGDFEVQLAASEVKQRVVARGTVLKQLGQTMQGGVPAMPDLAPPPVPPAPFAPVSPPVLASTSSNFQAPPVLEDQPPRPAPAPLPRKDKAWKSALLVGAIAGVLISIVVVALLVKRARMQRAAAAVAVRVATTPAGAEIRVNGEAKCNSNCSVSLPPGQYQLAAFLDGYQPSASNLKVTPGQAASIELKLEPQLQTVRILTDLPQGQVVLDDRPPAQLQDGQFIVSDLKPGKHTVKVSSSGAEASFPLEIAAAQQPAVAGPMIARNLVAVLVSSMGSNARVVTNNAVKLALNGQPQADANPAGVDLSGFRPGVNQIAVGEGKDQHILAESYGPAPMLTAFLKSDLNIGTLIVSTAEDNVRVYLNGKEYPRKTQRGQLRIPTLGNVNVRIAKEGFELTAPQTADVKKGSEVRLEFKLQPVPQVAMLQIREATPGAEVLLDQKSLGAVGDDGSFTANSVQPGEHTIDLRKDQFLPKRMQRQFIAGRTVAVQGAEGVLAAAVGTVKLSRTPADAQVVYRRADETQGHELRGNEMDLLAGNYVFTARAPGYTDKTERLQVAAGETASLQLALAKVVAAAPPPPKTFGMADFEDANAWSKQGDLWVHKGEGVIPFKLPANGTFTFTVRLLRGGSLFRGGRIRWAVQYVDAKDYDLFELDRKVLSSKVIEGGKIYDRGKFEHGLNDKDMSYTVQVEISPGQLVHRVRNGENWLVLDTWKEPGRKFNEGKFVFLTQGGDQIGLSDFQFVPR